MPNLLEQQEPEIHAYQHPGGAAESNGVIVSGLRPMCQRCGLGYYHTVHRVPVVIEAVDHPAHYQSNAPCPRCGRNIECVDIVEHLPFLRGNAIKYLFRAGSKGDAIEDLEKCVWYVRREISNLRAERGPEG